jgi:hypothetical protein
MNTSFSTVTQPQPQPKANNRERHEQKRRLYRSCDHCHKHHRPCDAASPGINPPHESEPRVDSHPPSCTNCREAGRNCSFEWLRSVAQRNLLRNTKRRFDVPRHVLSQTDGDLSSTSVEESTSKKRRTIADDQTHSGVTDSDSCCSEILRNVNKVSDIESTNQPTEMAQSTSELMYNNHFPEHFDSPLDIPIPKLHGANTQAHGESCSTASSLVSPRSSFSSSSGDVDPFKTGWYGWSPLKHSEWNSDSTIQTNEKSKISRWIEPTPSFSPPMPTFATYAMLRFQNPNLTLEQLNSRSMNPSMALSSNPEVNMQEGRLYETASKSFIISGLKQIYYNSLENGMLLWGTEQNCPFEEGNTRFRNWSGQEDSSALLPASLYQRAYQLDQALDPLRTRRLTAAENGWASRALNLAIMAFASRWSHLPMDGFSGNPRVDDITTRDGMSESTEFERLLQQSLYNEAMACIERWSDCDSLRIILAQVLVFFIQKPPDEKDILEVQNRWTTIKSRGDIKEKYRAPTTTNEANKRPDLAPETSMESSSPDYFTTSQSFRKLMKSDSRKDSLRIALRHLLRWSPKVRTFTEQVLVHYKESSGDSQVRQRAMQTSSNFNIMFWLGVMCDTASSALDRLTLTISDDDAELQFYERLSNKIPTSGIVPHNHGNSAISSRDNPGDRLAAPKLWGDFLMNSQTSCQNPFWYSGAVFLERAEKVLREASPLKILLMRKVCDMQTTMEGNPSPEAVERCISETLQVCTYWHTRFDEFFSNCIAQHHTLPFRIRTWYIMLIGHWNLAYLQVANCIEQFDKQLKYETPQSALRRSSFLVFQLQKEGIYSIADIARVSYTDIITNGYDKGNHDYHSTCRESSLLTDPCGDIMFLALSTSCDTLLAWSQTLQSPPDCANVQNEWLRHNVTLDELLAHCAVCIKALKVFGKQYDVATLVAKVFGERMKLERSRKDKN